MCGDGIVIGDETCDDGNDADGDGCSASCRLEGLRNLLENSHFDVDFSSWQDEPPGGAAWVDEDVDTRSGSGAAQLTGSPNAILRSECVALGAGDSALLRGWYRRVPGGAITTSGDLDVVLYAKPDCVSVLGAPSALVFPLDDWQFSELPVDLTLDGQQAQSARVQLSASSGSMLFDSVELVPEPGRGAPLVALLALAWLAVGGGERARLLQRNHSSVLDPLHADPGPTPPDPRDTEAKPGILSWDFLRFGSRSCLHVSFVGVAPCWWRW